MKKVLSVLMVMTMVLAMIPAGVLEVSAESSFLRSGDFYYSTYASETKIEDYIGTGGAVTIPNIMGGYPVTAIADDVFDACTDMTSITLPNTLTGIGVTAFYGCSGLTSISLPGTLKSIGEDAFEGCTGLTSLTLPNSITSIGDYAFYGCTGLTGVSISNNLASIGYEVFYECSGLTSVTIPSSVTSIGDYAFGSCTGLISATIPVGVASIGEGAFDSCAALSSAAIPGSVTSIGPYAFYDCPRLTSVFIPDSVAVIGNYAFYGCTGLTSFSVGTGNTVYSSLNGVLFDFAKSQLIQYPGAKTGSYTIPGTVIYISDYAFDSCADLTGITIPSSLTSIGKAVFEYCTGLTSVAIPSGVASIGDYAFNECTGLTGVTIPGSVKSIGKNAFYNCYGMTSLVIPTGVTSIGDFAFSYCDGLASVAIPNSVTGIGEGAFEYCSGLISVSIPKSVKTIKDFAFGYCSSLTAFSVNADNTAFTAASGVLFNKAKTALVQCPGGKTGSYAIPGTVTTIKIYAFEGCEGLAAVTIPVSVTSIGEGAFFDCSSLTAVTIPKSVKSIGDYAFVYCSSMLSILTDSANTVFSSVSGVLFNKAKTTLVQCPDGKTGSYAVPSSVTTVGAGAFEGCAGLTSVTIPNSVTKLNDWAFAYCEHLKSVMIPYSVTTIGANTFKESAALTISCYKNSVALAYAIGAAIPYKILPSVAVSSVKVNAAAASVTIGSTKQLTAAVSPLNATYRAVKWTSSNTSVAAVSSTGLVTAKAVGKATVTCEAKDGSGKMATCVITVIPKAPAAAKAARVSSTSIKVSWSAVTGAGGYVVYRYNPITKTCTAIKTTSAASVTVTGLTKGVTYYFKVKAYKTVSGTKIYSNYTAAVSAKTY